MFNFMKKWCLTVYNTITRYTISTNLMSLLKVLFLSLVNMLNAIRLYCAQEQSSLVKAEIRELTGISQLFLSVSSV